MSAFREVTLRQNAITATVAGRGYAYVGGFVDLAPAEASTIVVAVDVTIDAVLLNGEHVIVTTQVPPRSPVWPAVIGAAGAYEREGAAPEGFAAQLKDWYASVTDGGSGAHDIRKAEV